MTTDRKKAFIINVLYIAIIALIIFCALKYALQLIMPFFIAAIVAAVLHPLIKLLKRKLKTDKKWVAASVTVFALCTVGVLLGFIIVKLVVTVIGYVEMLPSYYLDVISPAIEEIFEKVTLLLASVNIEVDLSMSMITASLYEKLLNFSQIFSSAFSVISGLPNMLLSVIVTIISIFFMATDFDNICKWVLAQFPQKTSRYIVEIKDYVVRILFRYIRSYALILTITFTELLVFFTITHFITGLQNPVALAAVIALFDILPIVGTGTVLLPWSIVCFILGDIPLGICVFVTYAIVVIARQFIEPKVVGKQVGLHPLLTLVGMIVGSRLFGVIGLFGLPITFALLKDLNDSGKIHIFKPVFTAPAEEGAKESAEPAADSGSEDV